MSGHPWNDSRILEAWKECSFDERPLPVTGDVHIQQRRSSQTSLSVAGSLQAEQCETSTPSIPVSRAQKWKVEVTMADGEWMAIQQLGTCSVLDPDASASASASVGSVRHRTCTN